MNNREKAREIAKEYRAVLVANTDFDVNDLDLAEEDATRLTLEMAEWKDQQFKEYLVEKLESIRDCYQKSKTEYKKDYHSTQMVVIAEIINELFEEIEYDNSDREE